jgi:amphi-Trp domain-containing protein
MSHRHRHREQDEPARTVRARASLDVAQAAAHIEALARALRTGAVTIRSGAGVVALRTADRIDLELEAGEQGRDTVVHWALRWETPIPEEPLEIVPGSTQSAAPEPAPEARAAGRSASASSAARSADAKS